MKLTRTQFTGFGVAQTVLIAIILILVESRFATADGPIGSETRKPNIVFILVDDLGWTDLSSSGSDLHQTPNMDALASESLSFSNAYASHPTCSPSRAAIMSGKYPARLGIVSHAARRGVAGSDGYFLDNEAYTLAKALRDVGYTTCHIGKWHLGTKEGTRAKNQGFQHVIASNDFCCPGSYFYPYQNPDANHAAASAVPDLEDRDPDDHLTEALGDEAAKFIAEHKEEPFFLNLWYYAPHTPIEAKQEKVDKYKELVHEGLRHRNPHYAGLVEHLDDSVGVVLEAIRDNGLEDNTIVVFFSDNGGEIRGGITSNHPLRHGKVSQYLGGIRVPLFIKWPGVTSAGAVCDEPVIGHDFYPTFLKMAGIDSVPPQVGEIDGLDLSDLLHDPSGTLSREALYWLRYSEVFHYEKGVKPLGPCSTVIKGDWKLVEFFETPHGVKHSLELYNIVDDIGEQNDLASTYPEKVDELKQDLAQWREMMNAPPYKSAYREYEKIQ